MKKIFKNNKGFTLIELLAVIVVLAIIMVIATQQVNSTIKKARGESFYETVQSIRKNMQTVCATDNKIDAAALIAATSASDVEFSLSEDGKQLDQDIYGTLTVRAKENGKFTNVIFPKVNDKIYKAGTGMTATKTVDTPEIKFYTECPTTATEATEISVETGVKECPSGNPNCEEKDKVPVTSKKIQSKFKNFEGTNN